MNRRIVEVWVPLDLVAKFILDRSQFETESSLSFPADAKIFSDLGVDSRRGCHVFLLSHESFDEVPVGAEPLWYLVNLKESK